MNPAAPPAPSLSSRLCGVRVGVRRDLEVSRHVFGGEPSYIIRDPITFRTQRLDLHDYQILVSIRAEQTLGEIFTELMRRDRLSESDQEAFYQFVFDLHRLGFLQLPIADSSTLYQRFESRRRAALRSKWLSLLFLRIPVWNPDAFLNRTLRYARPLFSPVFLVIWLATMLAAVGVVVSEWHSIRQPFQGLWAAGNLPLIWSTLIVLKLFHEFGHAYACKHLGGHVPEMGVYLILFTPCAYVDATASWGFTSKWKRLMVCAAGMYVESIFAAMAVFVWSATEPSPLNSLAYNVIFLASVTTVLFNINPLMRYDGYYILSDALEIPNLRSRSQAYLTAVAKRWLLGVDANTHAPIRQTAVILLAYGVLAFCYRTLLIFTMAALLASKMFLLGLLLGAGMAGTAMIRALRGLYQYLWHAAETASVRRRAIAWGVVGLAGIPTALALIPLPATVQADGVVTFADERVVRATSPGFLQSELPQRGSRVETGQSLATLSNDELRESVILADAVVIGSRARLKAISGISAVQAREESERLAAAGEVLRVGQARLSELSVTSPLAGTIVRLAEDLKPGSFIPAGTPLLTVCGGPAQVRTWVPQSDFVAASPCEGDRVIFRPQSNPGKVITGTIVRVVPHAQFRSAAHSPSSLPVDRATKAGEGRIPSFEIEIRLDEVDPFPLQYGMTGVVRMEAESQTLLKSGIRIALRFVHKLLAGNG